MLLVAAALEAKGAQKSTSIVTQEIPTGMGSKKVKIPDICRGPGLESCNTFEFLEEQKICLSKDVFNIEA